MDSGENKMPARGIENGKYQGSKWIIRHKRLAIYLRDGMACAYCGATIEDGATLSLDHIKPYGDGEKPDNRECNLITCCKKCNSSRGNRDIYKFADSVAAYLNHGLTGQKIMQHIAECINRPLDIEKAKEIIARRGSWQEALNGGIKDEG